ncbi:MAG: hypothetical protein ACSNEK_02965 [Parachlamydiaceae bacterium]
MAWLMNFHYPPTSIPTNFHSRQTLQKMIKVLDLGEIAGGIGTFTALFTSIVCGMAAMMLNPPIGIGFAIATVTAFGCAAFSMLIAIICGIFETRLRAKLQN